MEYSEKSKSFFQDVYEVVRLVPRCKVTNYGAIARYLGSGKSSRMVGWAMNQAHSQNPFVPAHRVVNRQGMLTGKHHFSSLSQMQELLEQEGIKVIDDKIVDFKKYFWDPTKELDLEG